MILFLHLFFSCEAFFFPGFQGFNVRISGQDVGRATFSHRHAMLVDQVGSGSGFSK
jgi:2-oxoglutarate dehydrogenase complex dehydrogenase (E1) component-like enzyme